MFLILPYKTDLRLGQFPTITYSLIALCLIIHLMQDDNRDAIHASATKYCDSIYQADAEPTTLDYLVKDKHECATDISNLHGIDDQKRLFIIFDEYNKKYKEFSDKDISEVVDIFSEHLRIFAKKAPLSLDSLFSYDPSSWNPLSMIMAGLSHADYIRPFIPDFIC